MTKRLQSSTMAIANTFAFNGIEAVPVEVQVQFAQHLATPREAGDIGPAGLEFVATNEAAA